VISQSTSSPSAVQGITSKATPKYQKQNLAVYCTTNLMGATFAQAFLND